MNLLKLIKKWFVLYDLDDVLYALETASSASDRLDYEHKVKRKLLEMRGL